MNWANDFVAHYGYAAVFGLLALGIVGPLIPDETILVFAGILIHRGQLHPVGTALAAYGGTVCGITLSYTLGRTGAFFLLRKFGGKHVDRVHAFFERYGRWTLFFGYFIAGVRHFTALVAGASKLEPRIFAAYAYSGGLIWVLTFLTIGYFVGDQWARLEKSVNGIALVAAAVVVVGVVVWVKLKRRQKRYPTRN